MALSPSEETSDPTRQSEAEVPIQADQDHDHDHDQVQDQDQDFANRAPPGAPSGPAAENGAEAKLNAPRGPANRSDRANRGGHGLDHRSGDYKQGMRSRYQPRHQGPNNMRGHHDRENFNQRPFGPRHDGAMRYRAGPGDAMDSIDARTRRDRYDAENYQQRPIEFSHFPSNDFERGDMGRNGAQPDPATGNMDDGFGAGRPPFVARQHGPHNKRESLQPGAQRRAAQTPTSNWSDPAVREKAAAEYKEIHGILSPISHILPNDVRPGEGTNIKIRTATSTPIAQSLTDFDYTMLPVEIQEWLDLTKWHDEEYRGPLLANYHDKLMLRQQLEELDKRDLELRSTVNKTPGAPGATKSGGASSMQSPAAKNLNPSASYMEGPGLHVKRPNDDIHAERNPRKHMKSENGSHGSLDRRDSEMATDDPEGGHMYPPASRSETGRDYGRGRVREGHYEDERDYRREREGEREYGRDRESGDDREWDREWDRDRGMVRHHHHRHHQHHRHHERDRGYDQRDAGHLAPAYDERDYQDGYDEREEQHEPEEHEEQPAEEYAAAQSGQAKHAEDEGEDRDGRRAPYKTVQCRYWAKGHCSRGDRCTFKHG